MGDYNICFSSCIFYSVRSWSISRCRLKQIDSIIQVEGNKVIINKLPENYYYKNLNDDQFTSDDKDVLNEEEKQVLVFEEDNTYNVSYLIDKYGRKYELSEEDTKYLKGRGIK